MENLSAREQEEDDYSEIGSSTGEAESHLWENKPYSEDDLWYLKADEALDIVNPNCDSHSLASTSSVCHDQQLMFNINQLIVTVEAGQGNNTLPMILLESKLTGEVRNWSGRLSVSASTQMEMAYYNSKFALWEPVIEPIGNCQFERPNKDIPVQVTSPTLGRLSTTDGPWTFATRVTVHTTSAPVCCLPTLLWTSQTASSARRICHL